jgi:hypothetical protein
MLNCETCPKCGKEMDSFHHYLVYDKDLGKVIEICKECLNKQKQHRMFTKIQGKTRVID